MTIKSMFLGRRHPSKSKQNAAAAAKEQLEVDSLDESTAIEESRDDLNPFERFFSDSSSVFSGVITEAVSMADDIQTIITTDIDEGDEDDGSATKRKVVKGSHSDLAKEIKKLGKLEQKKEKAEKQIKKSEKDISMAEEERAKTLVKIKALSQKFELHNVMDHTDDDERTEGSVERTSHDDISYDESEKW